MRWTDVHYLMYNQSYWITQGQVTNFRTTCWDVAGIFTPSPYPQSITICGATLLSVTVLLGPLTFTVSSGAYHPLLLLISGSLHLATSKCYTATQHFFSLFLHHFCLFCFLLFSATRQRRATSQAQSANQYTPFLLIKKKKIKVCQNDLWLFLSISITIWYSKVHSFLQKML